jgi:hypothetical protein
MQIPSVAPPGLIVFSAPDPGLAWLARGYCPSAAPRGETDALRGPSTRITNTRWRSPKRPSMVFSKCLLSGFRGLGLEPALRPQGGHATESGGRDRLAILVILHVTGGKHAVHAGFHVVVRDDVPLRVQFH